jgi:uncharacterized protein YjbI with pentapeptide repeats
MANREHLKILQQGGKLWNEWREKNHRVSVDLRAANLRVADLHGANLHELDLSEANLFSANLVNANFFMTNLRRAELPTADASDATFGMAKLDGGDLRRAKLFRANFHYASLIEANLNGADLSHANLTEANLCKASLSGANLMEADLSRAKLCEANLRGANLSGARLIGTDLTRANATQADLTRALLIHTKFQQADITACRVYGTSAWDVDLTDAVQKNLIITPVNELTIQVDRLDVAQFIYLLLNNAGIRHVIDTMTSKVVLILGRFTPERKVVLDAVRAAVRNRGYLPILFDWQKPTTRDITETVSTLAHMARFVIADITDAKSIPQELMAIVPSLPSVPVQPLLLASQHEYGMFEHFKRYQWVLPVALYDNQEELLRTLKEKVIAPAEKRLQLAMHGRDSKNIIVRPVV